MPGHSLRLLSQDGGKRSSKEHLKPCRVCGVVAHSRERATGQAVPVATRAGERRVIRTHMHAPHIPCMPTLEVSPPGGRVCVNEASIIPSKSANSMMPTKSMKRVLGSESADHIDAKGRQIYVLEHHQSLALGRP